MQQHSTKVERAGSDQTKVVSPLTIDIFIKAGNHNVVCSTEHSLLKQQCKTAVIVDVFTGWGYCCELEWIRCFRCRCLLLLNSEQLPIKT